MLRYPVEHLGIKMPPDWFLGSDSSTSTVGVHIYTNACTQVYVCAGQVLSCIYLTPFF